MDSNGITLAALSGKQDHSLINQMKWICAAYARPRFITAYIRWLAFRPGSRT